jgi:hypothetical protein
MVAGASNRQRRSIRLPHYDYGESGAYFTLCVQNRTCFFRGWLNTVALRSDRFCLGLKTPLDSGMRRNDGNRSRLPVDKFKTSRLKAEGSSIEILEDR